MGELLKHKCLQDEKKKNFSQNVKQAEEENGKFTLKS